MNLKWKVILFLMIAFLLNAVLVFSFYRFCTLGEIDEKLMTLSNRYHDAGESIRMYLNAHPEASEAAFATYLSGEEFRFFEVEMVDQTGAVIYKSEESDAINRRIMSQILWDAASGEAYTISFGKSIGFQRGYMGNVVSQLVTFEIILLFITIVIAFFYMNGLVSKPLNALRDQFRQLHPTTSQVPPNDRGDEIKLLNLAFEELTDELDRSKEAQNELIASISHDIKNPLTSIMGYTERLIEARNLSESRKQKYHQIILNKAGAVKGMLDEFNTYIEGESGHLICEPVVLKALVVDLCEEYSEELSGINRRFVSNCKGLEADMVTLHANPIKIRRVVSNIIGNSVKYAGKDAVVYFSCEVKKTHVVFEIEDTGKGVPDADLERIFDLMFRCGRDRNQGTDQTGSGLGLTICKRIVEQHGGEIGAYQSPHGGLGIRFTLPI